MAVLTELERKGVTVQNLCTDSRAVQPGDVFVAFPGAHADGRRFIDDALAKGARAVIYEAEEIGAALIGNSAPRLMDRGEDAAPTILVQGLAQLSGEIAHLVYGRPSEKLWLAGVTGTNGKTSVSQWIAQAMNRLDRKCAVMGTLGNGFPDALQESANTTPDAITVHRSLARYVEQGAKACAMEVSSIGLDQGRVNGAHISTAIFTNLTRDHLDYHGDMRAYAEAKARLFEMPGIEAAVLNLDDAFGAELATRLSGKLRVIGYSLAGAASAEDVLIAEGLKITATGLHFTLNGLSVAVPVIGRFNASNILAVLGALLAAGIALKDAVAAVGHLQPPPGRLQIVGGHGTPLVVVDYAHTPDALEKALIALQETAKAHHGRLICVFGCGGERDIGKRPLMGAIAEQLADRVILTSDNPRSEDPQKIIADIRAGMKSAPVMEADRAEAIRVALTDAVAGDVILLAGKGHEPYQEIAGVRHPFSDVLQAQDAMEQRP